MTCKEKQINSIGNTEHIWNHNICKKASRNLNPHPESMKQ